MRGTHARFGVILAALAAASSALPEAAGIRQAPPPLPVIRLDGPSGRPARQAPQQQPPPAPIGTLPVTRLDDRARATDLDAPRTISLAVSQTRPILDMLVLLVRGTPFSVVASDRVEGTFAGELRDLTMRQAIEAVLFARDLDYDVSGTVIRVFPRTPVTRIFDVNYLNLRRTWQRGVRAAIAIPNQPAAVDAASNVDTDLFAELARGVETMLSASGRAHVDRTAGVVQATDFADRLDQIGLYLEAIEVRATRQVRFEARVFEVTLNEPSALAIDWGAVAASAGAALSGVPGRGTAGVRVADFAALMRAIAAQGTIRSIAAPQIVATNNEPAIMRVGTQEVYFVPWSQLDSTAKGDRAAPATVASGLTLTVTPQIGPDGIVQVSLAPTYAETAATSAKGPKGQTAPVLNIAEVETIARVSDGETIIVSGLLQDRTRTTTAKGAGGIFGSRRVDTVKSELVIMLTPTVVAPGAGAASR